MKIKIASIYVNDQENALRFYADVLGFVKKSDFSNGPFRWLTVGSPEEPNGVELQLALNDNPVAKTYQQGLFDKNQPAMLFNVDDVQKEYDRMKPHGAEFTMGPTKTHGSTIAVLKDTCGNLVQLVALERWEKK